LGICTPFKSGCTNAASFHPGAYFAEVNRLCCLVSKEYSLRRTYTKVVSQDAREV
jgi:hypothetical protein